MSSAKIREILVQLHADIFTLGITVARDKAEAAIAAEVERIIGEDSHGEHCASRIPAAETTYCTCTDRIVDRNALRAEQRRRASEQGDTE